HVVKVNGLRWISLMLLVPIPWAGRGWALPFLTALAPSERYAQTPGRRHKPITVWARQLLRQVHRWLPERPLVVVADSTYAARDLLAAVRPVATVVTRLRLDAPGCATLRPGASSSLPPEGPPASGRPAPADAAAAKRGSRHCLDADHDRSLVWPADARGRSQ